MPRKKVKVSVAPAGVKNKSDAANTESNAQSTKLTTVASRTRARRKWLTNMTEIPVDVFDEICRYLRPRDLLFLARTSKTMRAHLMSRHSESIWKSVRKNLERLPDCPSYLSEPAYANLLFSTHCHNCLIGGVMSVIWDFNVRYCSSCKKSLFRSFCDLGLTTDGLKVLSALESGESVIPRFDGDGYWGYHQPYMTNIAKQFLAIEKGTEEWQKAINARRSLIIQIREQGKLCQAWIEEQKQSRAQDREDIKIARLNQIVDRLRALGWGDELESLRESGYRLLRGADPKVNQPKLLTGKSWNTLVPILTEVLERYRAEQIIEHKRKEIQLRIRNFNVTVQTFRWVRACQHDNPAFLPTTVDFAYIEPFKSLLDLELSPDSVLLNTPSSPEILSRITLASETWRTDIDKRLAALIGTPDGIAPNESLLMLAFVAFDCKRCNKVSIEYPDVIAHRCAYTRSEPSSRSDTLLLREIGLQTDRRLPWSCKHLVLSTGNRLEARRKAIIACGLDPLVTTRQIIDDLDPRLSCRMCEDGAKKRVMTWRSAVCHLQRHPDADPSMLFDRASSKLEECVKRTEKVGEVARQSCVRFACTRCPPWGAITTGDRLACIFHATPFHKIIGTGWGSPHIYVVPDFRLAEPSPVTVITGKIDALLGYLDKLSDSDGRDDVVYCAED